MTVTVAELLALPQELGFHLLQIAVSLVHAFLRMSGVCVCPCVCVRLFVSVSTYVCVCVCVCVGRGCGATASARRS